MGTPHPPARPKHVRPTTAPPKHVRPTTAFWTGLSPRVKSPASLEFFQQREYLRADQREYMRFHEI